MGIGIILLNQTGGAVAMQCVSRPFVTDPGLAEAMAAYQGALLCKEFGGSRVMLEGDALKVVNDVRKDGPCRGEYGMVVNSLKGCLLQFPEWKVRHVRRQVNNAAHTLARMAVSQIDEQLWLDEFPVWMHEIVLADSGSILM